ncbi:hypothetical protein OG250_43950 [Streptomyces sp. NBC_00487]|uniref:hypothetical protein n=1 Tax=unclassified Streptomyces TaxID=2593676 RepID=UPI002DDBE337|nr:MULTISPECIES: hypothetical protein [unclassified Streptomyces]WRZ00877.1 hypothetical protein OG889_43065 [Streptomyces sp. NBC_00481]
MTAGLIRYRTSGVEGLPLAPGPIGDPGEEVGVVVAHAASVMPGRGARAFGRYARAILATAAA